MGPRKVGRARRLTRPRHPLKRLCSAIGLGLRARAAAALLGGCMVFLLGAGPAPAQGLLDANCPGPSDSTFQTVGRIAQTFTAQRTGSLVRGEFEINKAGSPGGDWVVQIVATDDSGAPVNILLASATPIADATVPAGRSRLAGVFASPLSVGAGKRYALVLTRPGAQQVAVWTWQNNPCPGEQFFSTSPGGPWQVFSPPNLLDSEFAVFVKPSNAFTLGEITRNKRKGTATLTVNVPNPGDLTASGKGVTASGASGAVISKAVIAPGAAQLLIKAKGKKKRKLNDTGKVKLNVAITFTPTGGDPSTQSLKVKLKKKL